MRKESCVKTDNKTIGKIIKYYRQQKGLTQEEFAEAIGVSPGYVSRLERGIKRASLDTLIEISITLEVTLDSLVGVKPKKEIGNDKETTEFLLECTEYERNIINDTIKAMKESIIRNRIMRGKG